MMSNNMKKITILSICLCFIFSVQTVSARRKKSSELAPTLSNVVRLIVDGDYKKAGKLAKKLEKRLSDIGEAESKFILGYVQYKMGNFSSAKGYFQKISANIPTIDDHVKYFFGSSCLELDSYKCAIQNFTNIIDNHPKSVWLGDAKWGLARAEFGVGNYEKALSIISKLEPDISIGLTDSEYGLFKASILEKMGRVSEAVGLLEAVYFGGESKADRKRAIKRLRELKSAEAKRALNHIRSTPGQLQLADQLMRNYHYDEGLNILQKFHSEKGDQHSTEILAAAYFKARDYKNAKRLYQKLVDSKSGRGSYHYLIKLAQAASRTNDFKTAISIYKRLLKGAKGSSHVRYLYKLGFLYLDANQYEKALGPFLELIDSNYRGRLKEKILWNIGWSYYKLGKYNEAISYFEKYREGGFGKQAKARALYWIAKATEKLGKGSEAKVLYSELIGKDRLGYYGFLASEKINGKKKVVGDWVTYAEAPVPVANGGALFSADLKKAKHLSDLGLNDLSAMELRVFDRKKANGQSLAFPFMKFAMQNGDYRSAHLISIWNFKSLLYRFPKNGGLVRFVWEGWYPQAFEPVVSKYSKEFGVDEKVAYSIMREESRFQSDVVSKADAIGLMQIIPSTAMRLAKELSHNDFELKQMFEPQINVKFGIQYLNDLSQMFNGEKAYMIASYNAGEEAVGRWIQFSDAADVEEFIEEIPYTETNKYVKRVLKSYWIYNELY